MQREINEEINIYSAKKARELKVKVVLDVGGQDTDISKELLQNVDIISPNETELNRILGQRKVNLHDDKDILECVTHLRKQYSNDNLEFLIKMGSKGCLFVDFENNLTRQSAFHIESMPIVDTTGAGDCFTGSFCGKYSESSNIKESLLFATAAAYKSITRFGASTSCPNIDEVNEVLKLIN